MEKKIYLNFIRWISGISTNRLSLDRVNSHGNWARHLTKMSGLVLIFCLFSFTEIAAQNVISGTITDIKDGSPLIGVNVVVKSTSTGTVSDINGKYSISASKGDILVYSFIGYTSKEVQVGDQAQLNISLEPDLVGLDEVVVIGYGVQKKKLNTGATVNIKGEDIQKLNTLSPMDALKGVSAGVSIIQNNGMPGSGTKVLIRGAGTIGNASPLYIVDGVSVSNIDFLAPSDIESIDVLKDAASAAIYGSRAANGVILVTTKKGELNKKPSVSYDFYHGVQQVAKSPGTLGAKDYMSLMEEAYANSGLPVPNWKTQIPNLYADIASGASDGTDWFNEIYDKNAPVESHSVNITGGNNASKYSFGFNHFMQDGIIGKQANNTYKRISVRLNSEHIILKKNDRNIVKIGENLSYSNTQNPTIRNGDIYWNDLHNAITTSPLLPMYASAPEDPAFPYHYSTKWNATEYNPIAMMVYQSKYNTNNNNGILGNAYAEIEPLPNLVFRSAYGFSTWFGTSRNWRPAYSLNPVTSQPLDNVSQGMWLGYNWTVTNTLAYKFKVKENHNFSLLAGQEATKNSYNYSMSTSNDSTFYNDYEHAYISNTAPMNVGYLNIAGRDDYGWGMLSYFGRLSYDYKETILATFVLRSDGSSNFAPNHKWGTFPSVSLGYVATNLDFFNNIPGLNYLKIRGSWGQNGNQDIAKFQYLSSLSSSNSDYFFGADYSSRSIGAYPARVPNPNVSWETSEQSSLGFDADFFENKLEANFDMYNKVTKGWLVVAPQLATNGTDAPYINGGEIQNKGFELVLNWKESRGDFKYGASVSIAHNKNKVTDIANDEKIIHGASSVLIENTAELFRAQVGYPIGYFWGYKTDGIIQNEQEAADYVNADGNPYFSDTKPGDLRFVDLNNDGVIDEKDKTMIGDPNPDYIFGFQLNAEYKGAYIQLAANGQQGAQIAKNYRAGGAKANFTEYDLGRWHGEGTSTTQPRIDAKLHPRNDLWISDRYIENADFLRLSTITVGYDVNRLFKGSPFQEARIYVSAKNLLTLTGYSGMDPEVGYGPSGFGWASGIDLGLYPSSKTFMAGLSLKF